MAHEEGQRDRSAAHRRDEAKERGELARDRFGASLGIERHMGARADKLLLNSKDAAAYLSIGARTLWEMTAPRGPVPVVRLGTAVRYPVADLKALIETMRIMPRKDSLP